MKIRFSLSTAVLSALVFTACNQETTAPAAAPQPTKVVVEADTSVRAELFEMPQLFAGGIQSDAFELGSSRRF